MAKINLAANDTPQNRLAVTNAVQAALTNARKFARFWHCVNRYLSEDEVYDHFSHHIVALGNLMDALIAAEADPADNPTNPADSGSIKAQEVIRTHDLYADATREKYELFVERIRKQWKKQCGDSRDHHDSKDCDDSDHHHRRRR